MATEAEVLSAVQLAWAKSHRACIQCDQSSFTVTLPNTEQRRKFPVAPIRRKKIGDAIADAMTAQQLADKKE